MAWIVTSNRKDVLSTIELAAAISEEVDSGKNWNSSIK